VFEVVVVAAAVFASGCESGMAIVAFLVAFIFVCRPSVGHYLIFLSFIAFLFVELILSPLGSTCLVPQT
jgi:hypothetical protein